MPQTTESESVAARTVTSASLIVVRYAIVGVLSLAGAVLFVRRTGPGGWATYTIAYFLTVNFDQLLGNRLLGLVVHGEREVERRLLRSTAALMQVVGVSAALLCMLAGVLLRHSALPHLEQALVASGICIYTYALKLTQTVLLERELDYRWSVGAEIVDQLSFYAVAVPLVLTGHGVDGLLIGIAIRGVLPFVIVLARVRAPVIGRLDAADTRGLLRYAGPSLAVGASLTIEGLAGYALLSGHPTQLAFIALATTIIGYAAIAQFIAQRVGFTSLTELSRSGGELARGIDRAERAAVVAGILIVAPIAATSPLWLGPVFGSTWRRAAEPMVLLGAAYATNGAINVLTAALLALKRPRDVLGAHLVMLVSFVLIALLLRPSSLLLAIPIAYVVSRMLGVVILRRRVSSEAGLRGGAAIVALAGASTGVTWLAEHVFKDGSGAEQLWMLLAYCNRSWLLPGLGGLVGPLRRHRAAR
jgi:O-antigen/teichoic acid export membrane protein